MKKLLRAFFALAGGFALSFVGLGALWIGAAWQLQALMFLPFLLLAFAIARTGDAGDDAFLLVVCGAAPIGALISRFRDGKGSHLMPILVVCAWLVGILSGNHLATRWRHEKRRATQP